MASQSFKPSEASELSRDAIAEEDEEEPATFTSKVTNAVSSAAGSVLAAVGLGNGSSQVENVNYSTSEFPASN
jgi:hypothetical protein